MICTVLATLGSARKQTCEQGDAIYIHYTATFSLSIFLLHQILNRRDSVCFAVCLDVCLACFLAAFLYAQDVLPILSELPVEIQLLPMLLQGHSQEDDDQDAARYGWNDDKEQALLRGSSSQARGDEGHERESEGGSHKRGEYVEAMAKAREHDAAQAGADSVQDSDAELVVVV